MDFSFKSTMLIGAIILTGLSAGLFFAWSVSVIPGTRKLADPTYLETMQSINRGILNPLFFIVFFGSLVLLGLAGFMEFNANRQAFGFLLGAFLTYLVGTIGVTGLGNVPLNDQLDILNLAEMSDSKLADFRQYYESKWNQLHQVRTVFAMLSFLISLLALLVHHK